MAKVFFFDMERLYKDIHTFRASLFGKKEEFYERLSKVQSPEDLLFLVPNYGLTRIWSQSRHCELVILKKDRRHHPSPVFAIRGMNSFAAALDFRAASDFTN